MAMSTCSHKTAAELLHVVCMVLAIMHVLHNGVQHKLDLVKEQKCCSWASGHT